MWDTHRWSSIFFKNTSNLTAKVMMMMKTSNVPYLPEEILTNILIRLPVKDLAKSKTVCKSWLALITSHDFLLRYSNHLSCLEDRTLVFLAQELDVKSLYTANLDSHSAVKLNFEGLTISSIVNTCNGLLLCAYYDDYKCLKPPSPFGFVLVNLSTFQYKRLRMDSRVPNRCSSFNCFGFGYDHVTDDYKVVSFGVNLPGNNDDEATMVYSLKANSWKKCNDHVTLVEHTLNCSTEGVLMNNNLLHWYFTSNFGSKVFSFNVSTEEWSYVPLPISLLCDNTHQVQPRFKVHDIGVQNGRLYVMGNVIIRSSTPRARYHIDYVWVMKEYGVRESWVKLVKCSELCQTGSWRIAPISYAGGDDDDDDEIWLIKCDRTSTMLTWYGILKGKEPREAQILGLPHSDSTVFSSACTRSLFSLSQPS